MEMIEKILSETAPYVETVIPFLYQDPLIEPRLLEILQKTKYYRGFNKEGKTIIYSNMAAMTEELAHKLVDSKCLDGMFISFYGPTEELYRKYQPNLNWAKTKYNIQRFIEIAKDKIKITMWYLDIPDLMEHYQSFAEEWGPKVDMLAPVGFDSFCGLFKGVKDYPEPSTRKICPRPWQGLNILSDGRVVPCCLDYNGSVVLGNAFEENCIDIWLSDEFSQFRELHQNGRIKDLPELCQKCEVWKRS